MTAKAWLLVPTVVPHPAPATYHRDMTVREPTRVDSGRRPLPGRSAMVDLTGPRPPAPSHGPGQTDPTKPPEATR
jgi:hypothetical protein